MAGATLQRRLAMLNIDAEFSSSVKTWRDSKSTWYYVSLPREKSEEIDYFSRNYQVKRRGWGAVRVDVRIGDTAWQTSIFPAFENGIYQLFLKAKVRKLERIQEGDMVSVKLTAHF